MPLPVFTRLAPLKEPEKVVLVVWLKNIFREALGAVLALETQLGGTEGMRLSHGLFRAVDTVENEFAKEGETYIPRTGNAVLAFGIDEQELVGAIGCPDVCVFAQLDVALRSEDKKSTVAPRAKAGGREPINPEVTRGAVVADEAAFAEVLEFGISGIRHIADGRVSDLRILGAGEKKELLALVAADVAEDATVFFLFKKPAWSGRGVESVGACAEGLNDLANGPCGDQLSGPHSAFDMDALAIVDGVFPSRGIAGLAGLLELVEGREGRFVGKVILASLHNLAPERPAFVGNGGRSDKPDFRVVQNFFKRAGRAGLRKFFHKGTHPFGNGIEDPLNIGPSLDQPIALAVDMPVIKMRGGHYKFASLANRRGFAHGGMCHSIG